MTSSHHHPHEPTPATGRSRVVFWLLLGFAAFYLLVEHRMHLAGLLGWLPLLFLLACPLLHVFGHGHHGGHGAHTRHDRTASGDPTGADTPNAVSDDVRPADHHKHRGDL